MRKITAVIKSFLCILSTGLVYTIYAIGLLFIRIFKGRYEPWRNKCLKLWGKLALTSLGVKVEMKGTPPEPPFFLVSNHLSYIDIPVYYYCLKTTFVSKAEIKNWPIVGLMARSLGIIFIDRNRKRDVQRVNTVISNKINDRQGVVLFPEGKTSAGDDIMPFRPSLLQHPAIEGLQVHYAAIRYQTSEKDVPARDSVAWWQDISMFQHLIGLASNRSITAEVTFGEKSIRKEDRKVLAAELHKEVKSVFNPMTPN
ncbi:lysophospholipid acyltransferase family protein [Rhodohalobacter sp. 614A]|uniref:lysophospholipid acyltransferase family protein n=1 Tax=Rhodohalobacter sp. 614A TaxID=2908649 RepID=UPI001F344A92|nr:1-acyl-sn-glycerol-3-phosphate acyltransferase [Rhodohalobacter sp. 614A]